LKQPCGRLIELSGRGTHATEDEKKCERNGIQHQGLHSHNQKQQRFTAGTLMANHDYVRVSCDPLRSGYTNTDWW